MNNTILKKGYPNTIIKDYEFWTLFLREEQVTIGSLVLVYKEDIESFTQVSVQGFVELRNVFIDVEKVLKAKFGYEKINYLGLMMVDKNVHLHIIPRYKRSIYFNLSEFKDYGWPKEPSLDKTNLINEETFSKLLELLNKLFNL